MKEDYPFEEIEKIFKVIGISINRLNHQKIQITKNTMFYPCSLTQVASFIWVMSEIIQLVM